MNISRLRRLAVATLVVAITFAFIGEPSTAAPGDVDGDLVPDSLDRDDDNDGILDTDEGLSCAASTITAFSQDFDSYAPGRVTPNGTGSVLPILSDGDNWWSRTGGTTSDGSASAASTFFLEGFSELPASDVVLWFGDSPATDRDFLFITKPIAVSPTTVYTINIDNNAGVALPLPAFELFISTDDGASWGSGTSLPHATTFQTNTIGYTTGAETSIVLRVGNSTAGGLGNDGGINNVLVTTPGLICSGIDTDGDTIEDHQDLDSDNDGISDLVEGSGAADPTNDPDRNGVIDGPNFVDVNADGLADSVGPGITPINSDGVDQADLLDLDSDNDGIPDAVEAQLTLNYRTEFDYTAASDGDGDGILSIFDTAPSFGGTLSVPQNSDSAEQPDYLDLDSDGDALLDTAEAGTVATGVSYAAPNGNIDDPSADLPNQTGDTSEVAYRELGSVAPIAAPDTLTNAVAGIPVTVDVLGNDSDSDGSLDPTTVEILDSAATNLGKTLIVGKEGTWSVDSSTGAITFTPLAGFTGNPTSINYRVRDIDGTQSNAVQWESSSLRSRPQRHPQMLGTRRQQRPPQPRMPEEVAPSHRPDLYLGLARPCRGRSSVVLCQLQQADF